MKRKNKPWMVEYRIKQRDSKWVRFGNYKTREIAERVMALKKESWNFCEFRAIGPSND